ncbi:TerB N-terminal domain-containing protein [Paenibacillus sp. Marseille-Q4541]|uniref:TerB N-terminal domain-containing protein n=1 Tax=Paenibacillus sp. Marseille-Q4541 TaxID=2831522 RepID=UPI001BAB9970|nr:TerB N-terminal domain-containing protein [Paenibacillus sp. Marseille-Q4541]
MDNNTNDNERITKQPNKDPKQSIRTDKEIRFAEYEWTDEEKEADIPKREDALRNNTDHETEIQDLSYVPIDSDWDGLDFLDDMQVEDWNSWDEGSSEDSFSIKKGKRITTPSPIYDRSIDPAFDIDKVKPLEMPKEDAKLSGNRVVAPQTFDRDANWEKQFMFLTREQTFVKQAREFESMTCSEAAFVSYRAYWPTYEQMSPAQKKWYFYWRKEVKLGRYPDTDLSYLFLYIYELIHGVGWSTPEEGLALLDEVWFGYGQREKKIDVYMREWLYDFCLVHGLEMPYTELMDKLPRKMSDELKEREWMRRFTADPVLLTWDLLFMLIDYDAEQSRFFKEQGRKDMKSYAPKVIALVDRYWMKRKGTRLIDRFQPQIVTRKRALFRSAVYDHDFYGRHMEVKVTPISEYAPLRAYLTQLVRFTENKLREFAGFKGRLRGVQLESEVEELISRYLTKEIKEREVNTAKAARPAVTINTKKLRRLQEESEEVRDMLMTDYEMTEAPSGEESHGDPAKVEVTSNLRTYKDGEKQKSRSKVQDLQTIQTEMDFDAIADIGFNRAEENGLSSRSNVDEVDLSNHHYRDESDSGQTVSTKSTPDIREKGQDPLIMWETNDLDEEWQEFVERLKPYHLEALYTLRENKGSAALQAIANQVGSMPALLIEEINEVSMEIIGDILIDGEEITEEYVHVLETLRYIEE